MDITKRTKGNIVILNIIGEIDLYNAPEIKDIINKLIEEQNYYVIIDLAKVSYIDSSGIGALISSLSNLKKYQGGLKIINVFASVKKVFELTKLTSFFDIFDSEDEAIEDFNRGLNSFNRLKK
ncbi:MAG: STAS domain-containing protein [Spirochaetota bacterium]|nr:STAS domain-containing protein [Spirochaetota bacterium]